MTKQNTYNLLICLTIVSFGFFGSLSHIFSLALIILTFVNHRIYKQKNKIALNAKVIFLALNGCFLLFLITSLFRSNFGLLLHSLSPMLPLPFIGMLIIFHIRTGFKLSSKKVSQFSQISVLCSLILYLFLSVSTDPNSLYYKCDTNRLKLFSGNPIPFSYAMLGISIFCLADWRNSTNKNKLIAFLFFLTGAYFSGFLSGTRGTLLSLILILPIIIFYLSSRFTLGLLIISVSALTFLLLFQAGIKINPCNIYSNRIENVLATLGFLENTNSSILPRLEMWSASIKTTSAAPMSTSILPRLEMWSASIKAISDAPIFGYGVTERFNALKPYLNGFSHNYTHPHNDILASLISSGLLGSIAALISIMSGFIAALLSPHWSYEKVLLGLIISIPTFITANVNTIFFNDITSAWLAFSSYLIWATDFKNYNVDQPKKDNF